MRHNKPIFTKMHHTVARVVALAQTHSDSILRDNLIPIHKIIRQSKVMDVERGLNKKIGGK